MRAILLAFSACLIAAPACAFEWVSAHLPTFARGAGAADEASVPTAFGAAAWSLPGQSASVSTFRISKDLLLGVFQTSGAAPFSSITGAPRAFDVSSTSLKLGLDLGRVTPFVTTTLSTSKASALPGLSSGFNTTGDLLAGRDAKAGASVGGGFNFAVTDSVQFGLSASVGTARPGLSGW